jgi:hypothetical protein
MRLSSLFAGAAALALGSSGCAGGDAPTDSTSAAISSEHTNGVAELSARLYKVSLADQTLVSYAVPYTPSGLACTGEMIGPNFMMTASHCDDTDRRAIFYTYRNQDQTKLVTESFNCHVLLNTFWRTDITLHFCDPNAAGENPGDKYGYLDFDVSTPAVGQTVYSYWYNPINSLGLGNAEIFSQGSVFSNSAVIWGPQGVGAPMNEPIGIGSDLWSQPGCSGSALINPANHRIIAGPISTSVTDAPNRWGQSAKTDFERASVDGFDTGTPPRHSTGIHDSSIASLNLSLVDSRGNPRWAGRLDKNNNYLFDIQEEAEKVRGENARDWYFLGFNSERRNALWDIDSTVTSFNPGASLANINVTFPSLFGGLDVLVHRRLPIDGNTKYRVSFMINTSSANGGSNLRVAFRKNGVEESVQVIPTNAGSGFQMQSFTLDAKSANPELAFIVAGKLTASVTSLSVVRDSATMDFDSADKRYSWRDDNTGKRALTVPDGHVEGTPNWAGYVEPTSTRPANSDWPLRNRQLALAPNNIYRMCAMVRSRFELPASDHASRVMRVLSNGNEVVRATFRPGTTWQRVCSSPFGVPTGDNNMQVGFTDPSASVPFYIDEITFTH